MSEETEKLRDRLLIGLQAMATGCSVPMTLWDTFSNDVLAAADELSRLQSLSDQNRLTGGWAYKLEPLLVDLIREQSEGEWDDATIRADAAKFNAAIIDMIRPSPPLPLPGGEEKR